MRLLVCGPRNFDNPGIVWRWLDAISQEWHIAYIVEGGASGVDQSAREWAEDEQGCRVFTFEAEWNLYGKAAGPIRNQRMFDEGKPSHVLAFQPQGKKTPGTQDTIRRAKKLGIPVILVEYKE